MDPIQWTSCTQCNLRGKARQDNLDTSEWTCLHCGSTNNSIDQESGNLTTLPFHQQDSILTESPDQEITIQEQSDLPTYNQKLPKGKKILHVNINGLTNKYEEIRYFYVMSQA